MPNDTLLHAATYVLYSSIQIYTMHNGFPHNIITRHLRNLQLGSRLISQHLRLHDMYIIPLIVLIVLLIVPRQTE